MTPLDWVALGACLVAGAYIVGLELGRRLFNRCMLP